LQNYAKPSDPPAKASFVRASKANPVFHATVNHHLHLVGFGAFLAREPSEFHTALNQMEKEKLLARWQILLNATSNAIVMRGVLQERLVILHRLNELGEKDIEGLSIVKALEATNDLVWRTDKALAAN
jgi:hypothetical protein